MKFVDSYFDRDARFSLGVQQESSTPYISIPVSNTLTEYEEYYALSDEEYSASAPSTIWRPLSRSSAVDASTTID